MLESVVKALPPVGQELAKLTMEICPKNGLSPHLLMGIAFAESAYGRALSNGSGDFIARPCNPTRDALMKKTPLPGVVCRTLEKGIPSRKIAGPVQAWVPTSTGWAVGVFQIDWESHLKFIATGKWSNLKDCLEYAISVLLSARAYLSKACALTGDELDAAMIAAYNAGAGGVARAVRNNKPVDSVTFHPNYVEKIKKEADRLAGTPNAWRSPTPQKAGPNA